MERRLPRPDAQLLAARHRARPRTTASASEGIGSLARRLAGSNHVFSLERGPLASVNFITAHDGFTAADLVAYDQKHNLGNGENNRDGSNDNKSFNHGVEGRPRDAGDPRGPAQGDAQPARHAAAEAGIPMLTAGDEFGRTQRGNNNAYCHDDELTWLQLGARADWQEELLDVVAAAHPAASREPGAAPGALRTVRARRRRARARWTGTTSRALSMSLEDWDSPAERTLQYLAASTPEFEEFNRILLVVHGLETDVTVTLPEHEGVERLHAAVGLRATTTSARSRASIAPASELAMAPTSMLLFRAD